VVVVDSGGSVGGMVVDCSIVVLGTGAACVVVVLRPGRFAAPSRVVVVRCSLLALFSALAAPPLLLPAAPVLTRVVELPSAGSPLRWLPASTFEEEFLVSTVFGFDELPEFACMAMMPTPSSRTSTPTPAMIRFRRC